MDKREEKQGNLLIIDDDACFLEIIKKYVSENYPCLHVMGCLDPVKGLAAINADLDLLLLDLEMPGLDGGKILSYARSLGIHQSRIIILSGRDADYLHDLFPMGSCLAVLNKYEARQKDVLDMIFSSLQVKCGG